MDLRAEVAVGDKSPGTSELYETTARRISGGLGELRLREVTVSRVDRFLTTTATRHGLVSAKRAKTVLNGVLGLAARHDAIRTNPVRDTTRIKHGEKESAVALTLTQVYDLRTKLAADQKAQDWDLLDFVDMLRRRQAEVMPNEWNVVFTSPTGLLRDPSNTQADLRDVFTRIGYPWVTSHVYRKTAATLLDEAGVTARKIADQLGQSQVSVTQDFYLGRKIASEDAARVLEVIGRPGAATLLAATDGGGSERVARQTWGFSGD